MNEQMLEGGAGGDSSGSAAPPRPPKMKGHSAASEDDLSGLNQQQRDSSASAGTSPGAGYFSDRSSSSYHHPHSAASINAGDMSPWNQPSSPYSSSPWSLSPANPFVGSGNSSADLFPPGTGLIGSLVREEGHIYSIAAAGGLLYTGSDSKNIRVWKDQKEYSGFKSASGLVKAIIVSSGDHRIFSGHQDGKIRVWRACPKSAKSYKRAGTFPRLKDLIRCSLNPSNYVDPKRKGRAGGRRGGVWIKHSDAVSCLALEEEHSLLYSGSWDRTLKVWRITDCKCLESIAAHEDAINAVLVAFNGLVFTGSADGTVKLWKRELISSGQHTGTQHSTSQTLLRQECAVTALAVTSPPTTGGFIYCGSSDGVVNFWEKHRGMAHGGTLKGHKMAVLCLAAAGGLLFSGSADKSICVWRRDGAEHTCMSVLTGHSGPVKCIAVEPDDSNGGIGGEGGGTPAPPPMWMVYSGSLDKSVKVWKVAEIPLPPAAQQQYSHYGHDSLSSPTHFERAGGPPQFDSY